MGVCKVFTQIDSRIATYMGAKDWYETSVIVSGLVCSRAKGKIRFPLKRSKLLQI